MDTQAIKSHAVCGEFVNIEDERYYAIKNVDEIPPFFVSLVSDSDHWLFIASNGALTAGRVSPETALFPYDCVDKIYDDALNTGSKTLIRVKQTDGSVCLWEPFNNEHSHLYSLERTLYKNTLGNKIRFEEINRDLGLSFCYSWESSEKYGFVRTSSLLNQHAADIQVEIIDGIQNVLPAGTPKFTQTVSSNLVDAYKFNEVDSSNGLALYTLYSGITDRAEPCESLKASTIFSLGLSDPKILLSSSQLLNFKKGRKITPEDTKRGMRGAYLLNDNFNLAPNESNTWSIIANIEQAQTQISTLRAQLNDKDSLQASIDASVEAGSHKLATIMASADGFQALGDENTAVHHYANTLFNVLRGGIFAQQYEVSRSDIIYNVKTFNKGVFENHKDFLEQLPENIQMGELIGLVQAKEDGQLTRLCLEYLPIFFGRRHGDPSRPWNQFLIKLKDEQGDPLLTYQGNWRDIFQNWEALSYSYPEFVESVIAKFVNASTIDGYNPYRIMKEGIDWEVEEPDDPWSYIGYWGDHQIIYLLKLLELSQRFHPSKLNDLLSEDLFCYANVPYKIKRFDDILENAKDTVIFDEALAEKIEQRVSEFGADGKLLLDANQQVYQVNLLEKLLVPLLAKLGNFVVDGGIWLNTQRPEWNDANNAIVGQGLSMVTLNYLRRYVRFMQDTLKTAIESGMSEQVMISKEVTLWLDNTARVFESLKPLLNGVKISNEQRFEILEKLGLASCNYRSSVYEQEGFSGKTECRIASIQELLSDSLLAIEHTIETSKRQDNLYHAYNLLSVARDTKTADVSYLYPMLEGQVAALSSGKLSAEEAIEVTQSLFDSDVYRADQNTFMLYPDRPQQSFMLNNVVSGEEIRSIPALVDLVEQSNQRLIQKDHNDTYRFHPEIVNKGALIDRIAELKETVPSMSSLNEASVEDICALYESIFNHQAFTGRSGGMFGFEGLGCIYWHMVSKLLLALGENYQSAKNEHVSELTCNALAQLYYRVRAGIGFNKSPEEYGAFPTDPYSHTPKHAGAQQPGMTGQVKEELIARFIELGIEVKNGKAFISPSLLLEDEFLQTQREFRYLDVSGEWQSRSLEAGSLAFTWCQVPFIYQLSSDNKREISVFWNDGKVEKAEEQLSETQAASLFQRRNELREVVVQVPRTELFKNK